MRLKAYRLLVFLGLSILINLVFQSKTVLASTDLVFTCRFRQCQLNTTEPMFSELNIKPGATFEQSLIVKNQSDEVGRLLLRFNSKQTEQDLAKVLIVQVKPVDLEKDELKLKESGGIFLSYLLGSGKPLILGGIMPRSERRFLIQMSLDPNADNSFQAKQAKFDLGISLTFLEADLKDRSTQVKVKQSPLTVPTLAMGQVLGASDKITTEPRLKSTLKQNPWLKHWLPILVAGLSMLSVLVLMGLIWILVGWIRRSNSFKEVFKKTTPKT